MFQAHGFTNSMVEIAPILCRNRYIWREDGQKEELNGRRNTSGNLTEYSTVSIPVHGRLLENSEISLPLREEEQKFLFPTTMSGPDRLSLRLATFYRQIGQAMEAGTTQ